MRVTFVGVGEAFDETLDNTSLLVERADKPGGLLLDCGFTAASAYWRVAAYPLGLDGVVLSHYHGDHWFGLPALLVRMVEQGRTNDLAIVGQAGVKDMVARLMDLAYPNILAKAAFPIRYHDSAPGASLRVAGFDLSFAQGDHPRTCLGVRVSHGGRSLYYSGDGRPTAETLELALGVDLVVHEAFSLDPDTPGHGTVDGALDFASKTGARTLALVHLNRRVRKEHGEKIIGLATEIRNIELLVPQPGRILEL